MSEQQDPLLELHGLLVHELLSRFRLGASACPSCGCAGISPQLMTVARQLLSDNEMRRIGGARPEEGKLLPMKLPFDPKDDEQPVQRRA